MSNKKTLLSLAVAAGLGAVSLQANAAAPTVYGDLSFALVYTGAYADTGVNPGNSGSDSSYTVTDNVSLLGVKGEAAKIGSTSYFYDFNFILDGGSPATHLAVVGMDGGFGKVSIGSRVDGLFNGMVDGGTYVTNWFYTPGMSALQVNQGVTYESKLAGPFQFGVQAFDIAKGSGQSTTNYTGAASYTMGGVKVALGYTSYSDYAMNGGAVVKYAISDADTNQFGEGTNSFSGVALKSTTGVSVGYSADKFSVVAAYDMRKPNDAYINTNDIKTAMLTGTFAVSPKTTLAANYSSTTQSGTSGTGTIITAMASYAAADNLLYTLELQSVNKDANVGGLTGTSVAAGDTATKSSTNFALGVIYSF